MATRQPGGGELRPLDRCDLAYGSGLDCCGTLFLVAPDGRQKDVRQQIRRPVFSRIGELNFRYLPYGELLEQQEAIIRFGSGLKPVFSISKALYANDC